MLKIYVIIPVYNASKYIKLAVNSVLKQPYDNIEVILVNDGSTDGSKEICNELSKDSKITVIHSINKGVSSARNLGIEYVINNNTNLSNIYIAFCDADDLWNQNIITQEEIDKIDMDQIDIFSFGSIECNEDGNCFSEKKVHERQGKNILQEVVWEGNRLHFAVNIIHAKLLQKYNIRFDLDLKYSEDKIFIMKCFMLGKYIYIFNKILYIYRIHGVSAMHKATSAISYYIPIINAYLQCDEFIKQYYDNEKDVFYGYTLARIYIMDMIMQHYREHGKRKELKDILKKYPYFLELLENQEMDNYLVMKKHPILFEIKYNMQGILIDILLELKKITWIRKLYEKYRRFPNTKEILNYREKD